MPRHRRHDPLVLVGIAVPVVNVGHRAGPVIGDPVHRVAAEAEPGDPRQAGAPQIVRRGALDARARRPAASAARSTLLLLAREVAARSAPARARDSQTR